MNDLGLHRAAPDGVSGMTTRPDGFTPGPWTRTRPFRDASGVPGADIRGPYDRLLGWIMDNEANADLVAAAPDLYDALKAIIDGIVPAALIETRTDAPIYMTARAALARARGEAVTARASIAEGDANPKSAAPPFAGGIDPPAPQPSPAQEERP